MTTLPILNKDFVKEVWTKTEMDEKSREVMVTQIQLDEYKKCRMDDEELVSRRMKRLLNITRRLPVPNEEHYLHISDQEEEEDDDDVKIIDGVFEEAVDEFPELSANQESEVNRALKCMNASKVLVEGFRLQITSKDISTLAGLNWLNDEVINFYMSLIVERSQLDTSLPPVYAFNTFFYPKVAADGHKSVRRWTKNVDLFGHGLILVPVHLGVHWCLAVIDFYKKELQYYDSMGGDNRKCLDVLLTYLVDEMNDKKQEKFDTSGWVKILLKDIPQQMNGSDCGMFACKFAEYVTRRAKFTFNQSHMPYFRRRMIYEILTKKLM
ncbi:hypothetical protein HELRODRAFT_102896 [Helobdella robusta]|uniref:Ubiquitin-like protease family profile domain-containing protein n=1 Tax=Helobdella robusta TaxID=6412 RepID=T1EDC8_HELRO|nr:hypothetical protein HELRODRAFT_102896 [Helobdella robusta]ESN94866.1 hypothetical protein HELRODRAFT_102896 [Helobdella robusta]